MLLHEQKGAEINLHFIANIDGTTSITSKLEKNNKMNDDSIISLNLPKELHINEVCYKYILQLEETIFCNFVCA